MLSLADSAAAHLKLLEELGQITSAKQLTTWAFRHMATKNALTAGDAAAVEDAFRARLAAVAGSETTARSTGDDPLAPGGPSTPVAGPAPPAAGNDRPVSGASGVDDRAGPRIDKSVLTISEPRRYRNKAHLKFVASQACLLCGRQPADPHHLSFAQQRALGRKVSDEFTVPLCRSHHREVHRFGNERNWWARYNLDPLPLAQSLWTQTHPVFPAPEPEAVDQGPGLPSAGLVSTPVAALPKAPRNRKTKPINASGGP
jgi:hypothetical protein